MAEKDKQLADSLARVVDTLPEREQGYLLGYAECLASHPDRGAAGGHVTSHKEASLRGGARREVSRMEYKKSGQLSLWADQKRKKRSLDKTERLYRRILFVIRWSNFDSYWDVVDTLEALTYEYRKMLGDSEEIIQKSQEIGQIAQNTPSPSAGTGISTGGC